MWFNCSRAATVPQLYSIITFRTTSSPLPPIPSLATLLFSSSQAPRVSSWFSFSFSNMSSRKSQGHPVLNHRRILGLARYTPSLTSGMSWHLWHDSFLCETWCIRMWDTPHSFVRHDSLQRRKHLSACDMTRSCVRYDLFIRETWQMHM